MEREAVSVRGGSGVYSAQRPTMSRFAKQPLGPCFATRPRYTDPMAVVVKYDVFRTEVAASGGKLSVVKERTHGLRGADPKSRVFIVTAAEVSREGRTWTAEWEFDLPRGSVNAFFVDVEQIVELTDRQSGGSTPPNRVFTTVTEGVTLGRRFVDGGWRDYLLCKRDGSSAELTFSQLGIADFVRLLHKAENA